MKKTGRIKSLQTKSKSEKKIRVLKSKRKYSKSEKILNIKSATKNTKIQKRKSCTKKVN